MKRSTYIWSIIALAFLWLPAAHAADPEISALAKPKVVEAYGRLPLSFEANQGQTDQRVRFLSHGSGYSLFLTGDEAVLALKKPGASTARDRQGKPTVPSAEPPAVVRMRLVGANAAAKVTGLGGLPGKSNYFIGNDPKKWRTNMPNYAKVKYTSVYPGVDLVYYGNQGQLEYDFVVQPGADPGQIALQLVAPASNRHITKMAALRIDKNGELVVATEGGEVIFHKPVVYQPATDNGQWTDEGGKTKDKHFVGGNYVLEDDRLTFEVARYDKTRPLVIDPTLAYSTYLGGSGFDGGSGIAVDASGNAYVTGATDSSDFPTTAGAFQTTFGGGISDVFVSKLNATGSALVYSTYLGGSGFDGGSGIAVDASGNAYVTGATDSSDFPTTAGAFQTTFGGGISDVFVTKLNSAGSALLYSTYLGGSNDDGFNGTGIAVDASRNAYVAGSTASSNFPITPGAFQTTFGGAVDAFVAKLNAAGSALVYCTYLGGSDNDFDQGGIAVDSSGNAYVSGTTGSSNFPITPAAFQKTAPGNGDVFVSKLNSAGSALLYSTYLGGSGFDFGDVGSVTAVDASGNAYVTGGTFSSDFPTIPDAFQTTLGGNNDAFVTKLNATGSALLYSTYLGGSGGDQGTGIGVDASGNTYVTGDTDSSDFPTTPDAFQTTARGNGDFFVTKLNSAGSALLYSTYLGGSGGEGDVGSRVAVDASGDAYVRGSTTSSDFPTTAGAFQTAFGGGVFDTFVSKFSFGIPFSSFSGKLELDLDAGSFDLNAGFSLGAGGSINPPTQPVSLTIGTYSVTIPAGSFVRNTSGYAFEGIIKGVSLEVLIKFGSTPGSYRLLAGGRGANLKGTTNPVTVTLSIGDDMGTTQIHAEFE